MGILLISMGVFLFVSQLNGRAAVEYIVKGWPLVLLLLGGEVLFYSFIHKGEQVNFDLFSIITICLIGLFTLGIYGLWYTGVVPLVAQTVSSQNFVLAAEPETFEVDGTTEKIIIEAPDCSLTVRPVRSRSISVYGSAQVVADSKETAQELLSAHEVLFRKSGEILQVSFNGPRSAKGFGFRADMTGYTVWIPEDVDVEIINRRSLSIHLENLRSNWLIKNLGQVEIFARDGVDAVIKAVVDAEGLLGGNVDWKVIGEGSKYDRPFKIYAEAGLGNGDYTVNVLGGSVTVNKI